LGGWGDVKRNEEYGGPKQAVVEWGALIGVGKLLGTEAYVLARASTTNQYLSIIHRKKSYLVELIISRIPSKRHQWTYQDRHPFLTLNPL
jgi:hypothetical protein